MKKYSVSYDFINEYYHDIYNVPKEVNSLDDLKTQLRYTNIIIEYSLIQKIIAIFKPVKLHFKDMYSDEYLGVLIIRKT